MRVILSNDALVQIVLSALEAYELGQNFEQGDTIVEQRRLETIGMLLGHHDTSASSWYVDFAYHSVSSLRNNLYVVAHEELSPLIANAAISLMPQRRVLGDFHTHPYGSKTEVEQTRGYQFSASDLDGFRDDDLIWQMSGNRPCWVGAAISRTRERGERDSEDLAPNCVTFVMGRHRIWITACVGKVEGGKRRLFGSKVEPRLGLRSVALDLGLHSLDALARFEDE